VLHYYSSSVSDSDPEKSVPILGTGCHFSPPFLLASPPLVQC
jgi:hypothetical protein